MKKNRRRERGNFVELKKNSLTVKGKIWDFPYKEDEN
jgi:hypothetical protein